jgi:membrane protein CcdC involved in cytochrome C biogenesis
MTHDSTSLYVKTPSKAWYLLPIFLGLIGGIIMFVLLRNEDRGMANKGLILGIILMAIGFMILLLGGIA